MNILVTRSVLLLFLVFSTISSLPVEIDKDTNNFIEVLSNGIEEELSSELTIDLTPFNNTIFGNPNPEVGEAVSNWSPDTDSVNPEELGSYLEGDMLIPHGLVRNGLTSQSSRWPGGIIPLVIEGSFTDAQMDIIDRGIKEYHSKTCIRFKPRTNERDYVAIVNDKSGCWSSVGRVGGRQLVNIQTPSCLTKPGTFIHEMMHAIGFMHEQNRHDRDAYVTVQYENIKPETTSNFGKVPASKAHPLGVNYDYGSVMHYSAYAFSRNGQPTIIPKQNINKAKIGQRIQLSELDVEKINRMYECDVPDYDYGDSAYDDYDSFKYLPKMKKIVKRQAEGKTKIGQRAGFSSKDLQKINKMYKCGTLYSGATEAEYADSGESYETGFRPGRPQRPGRPGRPGNRPSIISNLIPLLANIVSGLTQGLLGDENTNNNQTFVAIIDNSLPMDSNQNELN